MRKYAPVLVAAVLTLGFAPAPFPKPDRSELELKKLQGTWVRVQNIAGGGPFPQMVDFTVVIADDRMTYSQNGSSVLYEYALTLKPQQKPKALDARGVAGMAAGHIYRGVYRLEDDDTLILCSRLSMAENARPVDFDSGKPGVLLEVFKRQGR